MSTKEYLFIDIECCDGHHICSFGFVICDDNFNIIRKEDILINPEKRFKLGRAGFEPRIHLAHKPEKFLSQPNFAKVYKAISKILEKKIVIGHSILDDIKYLRIACDRYKLPQFENEIFCTQLYYMQYNQDRNRKKLSTILEELNIDTSNKTFHKSCDDAELSMMILKKMCEIQAIKLPEVIS